MKTKLFALILSLFVAVSSFAQSGGGGYFFAGYNHFFYAPIMGANITGVNNRLPQGMPVIGGGGMAIINGVVIGGRGVGNSFVKALDLSGVKAKYSFGGGEFNMGYVVLHSKSLLSFLYIGLGGYSYGVELENKSGQSVDLGSVIVGDGAKVSYEYGSFTLTGGLSIKMVKVTGLDLGLDLSYVYPLKGQFQAMMIGVTFGSLGVMGSKSKDKE